MNGEINQKPVGKIMKNHKISKENKKSIAFFEKHVIVNISTENVTGNVTGNVFRRQNIRFTIK